MRILVVTVGILIVGFFGMIVTKQWGRAQVYPEYKHAFFNSENLQLPLTFKSTVGLTREKTEELLLGTDNLYLEVAFTQDQIMVLPFEKLERQIRYYNLADIKDKVMDIDQLAPYLKANRRLILKLKENTRAEHEVFVENLKKAGMEKAQNFIVVSDYEAPLKALKELAPEYLFGSTRPEILKIVAMQSMNILEAATIRADALIQPLEIRNQDFYSEEIVNEMKRRHIKIIVGPISASEVPRARQINPFGIILSSN